MLGMGGEVEACCRVQLQNIRLKNQRSTESDFDAAKTTKREEGRNCGQAKLFGFLPIREFGMEFSGRDRAAEFTREYLIISPFFPHPFSTCISPPPLAPLQ